MNVKVTYYLEVISSCCYWAEPAWAELKQRYDGKAEFGWKIAQMPLEAYPASKSQLEWFCRRSGTIMRSPFMLNCDWFQPGQIIAPNLVAEAGKDFGVTDDRIRLALSHAGDREGKKVGQWDVAVEVAAKAVPTLSRDKLLDRAKSQEVAARWRLQRRSSMRYRSRSGRRFCWKVPSVTGPFSPASCAPRRWWRRLTRCWRMWRPTPHGKRTLAIRR